MVKRKKLDIIYEDKELLVVNKPTKLLTIATLKEKELTLYHEAREYVKKQNPKIKIFIVHRLDKDTSGIVVFAKKENIKKQLQNNWNSIAFKREYLAIVSGQVKKSSDILKNYLREDKNFNVYVTNKENENLAITSYERLGYNKSYSLLKINIFTGKKNQIRVQLANIGYPIIGDKKYNNKKSPINRLGLHASVLSLKINNKEKIFNSKIPKEFKLMFDCEVKAYEEKNYD